MYMGLSNTKKQVEQDTAASLASPSKEEACTYESPRIEKREKLAEITGGS
jgi:hypothetical protein